MSQEHYVIATADGTVTGRGMCAAADFVRHEPPEGGTHLKISQDVYFSIVRYQDWYVANGMLHPRVPMTPTVSQTAIEADGEDEAVLSGLPDLCTVHITGTVQFGPAELTGGTLTITCTTPGAIFVSVTAGPPHGAWEGRIDAT